MTVYQAVKQYSHAVDRDGVDTDTDTEQPFGSTGIWVQAHTILYRPAMDQDGASDTASSPKKTKSDKTARAQPKKKDELWTGRFTPQPQVPFLPVFNLLVVPTPPSNCLPHVKTLCVTWHMRAPHIFANRLHHLL